MASLLKQGTLPTVEALRAELNQNRYDHRYMTHYFQHGGLLEHAMNALISGTREEVNQICSPSFCDWKSDFQLPRLFSSTVG